MTVQISAAICTRDRADYLRKAVESLTEQSLDAANFEIIVVDNGSSDDTKQVVTEEFSSVSNLRYLYEPVPGLSRARNLAWQSAEGEYIVYLDDDAIANPNWMNGYLETFRAQDVAAVGGDVFPLWEAPRPDWLHDRLLSMLSVYQLSETPTILSPDQAVAGCNVGYTVADLRAVGGFNESLGRTGKGLLSGEESLLREELEKRSRHTLYEPSLSVEHHVAPSRLNKSWFRRRAFDGGRSEARLTSIQAGGLTPGQRVPLFVRELFGWMLPRLAMFVIASRPDQRFYRECQVRRGLGFIKELLLPGGE